MKLTLLGLALISFLLPAHAQIPGGVVNICFPKQHADVLNFLVGVARDRGFFEAEKLDVKINVLQFKYEGVKGPLGTYQKELGELSKGGWGRSCDIGTISAAGAMALIPERRAELVPLYLSQFDAANDMDLVVGASSKVKKVEDLKGKVIRVGSLPVLLTLANVLKKRGMNLLDVRVRNSNSDQRLMGGINEGHYDAAFAMPLLSQMLESRGTVKVIEAKVVSRHLTSIPGVFLFANRMFVDTFPESLPKFQRALDKARVFAAKNPEALTMAAENLFNQAHSKRVRLTAEESALAGQAAGQNSLLDMRKKADAEAIRARMKAYHQRLMDIRAYHEAYNLGDWLNQSHTK